MSPESQNPLSDAFIASALAQINEASDESALQQLKLNLIGKKSELAQLSKTMGSLGADEKKQLGQSLHEVRTQLGSALEARSALLKQAKLNAKLASETIDVTLQPRGRKLGGIHPVTQIQERMSEFFIRAGFEVANGPEVESEFYNFEALNIPSHHPARAMHDTFYFDTEYLLRTHTSSVQIRAMQQAAKDPENSLPLKIICPGRVYRCDSDQTHSPMFHQLEGLVVTESANFAQLKSLIQSFLSEFFGRKLDVRFRPSYFPFTEPSAEVDLFSEESGRWLEVLGCGMVHPKVLENCGIDPSVYTGYAFGMGIERFAMLYFGVTDLRLFFQNDLRFLNQFA